MYEHIDEHDLRKMLARIKYLVQNMKAFEDLPYAEKDIYQENCIDFYNKVRDIFDTLDNL